MHQSMRLLRRRTLIMVGVGLALALTVVGSAVASQVLEAPWNVTPDDPDQPYIEMAVPDYPVNDDGLTFGSSLAAPSIETQPDLILVVTSDGREGYVYRDALLDATGHNVTSPAEALAWQEREESRRQSTQRPPTIPAFDADGKTVIGEFVIE